ncbi:MAG: hypothetical protein QME81_17060, partial [bacterium]|nr:hypothetical protein [bacterium]
DYAFTSAGSYNWYVKAGTGQAGDTVVSAQTWGIIIDNTNPSVTVTAPNGSECWAGTEEITWTASDTNMDSITINYSSNGGTTWNLIATGETNDGSYLWNTTPRTDGANYLIRIIASDCADNTNSDQSNANFIVTTQPLYSGLAY